MTFGQGEQAVRMRRFASVQSQQDHRFPHGRNYYLKPGHLTHLDDDTVAMMVDAMRRAPEGDQQIEVMPLGGAIADVDEAATAFPRRDARFAVNVTGGWQSDSGDDRVDWARSTHTQLTKGSRSAYVNFVGTDGPSIEDIYGAAKADRLRAIKQRYDPDQIFSTALPIRLGDSQL